MKNLLLLLLTATMLFACNQKATVESNEATPEVETNADPLDWMKNANIYEVNTRQYTSEGTFNAFAEHLPRLKEMGVDILWFMPIYPIGEEARKGTLGSPYSISDYKAVNPNLGTDEDFRKLVNQAHAMGFKVVLDWVANHTSFGSAWIKAGHKDWYTQNEVGDIIHPAGTDWTDVADLNYDNQEMRAAMIDALKYWVSEFNIDGYRCDVAGSVPTDFWAEAIAQVNEVKPLFWLAEAEDVPLVEAGFHATYGWHTHHLINQVAKGEITLAELEEGCNEYEAKYPPSAFQMQFTTNHDENSWNGTVFERLGDGVDAMAVFAFTFDDLPLIYSGQEAGLNKRLKFFDKDEIDWSDISKSDFFQTLLKLRHENEALWNGEHGGEMIKLKTTNDENVFAFKREKGTRQVVVLINMTDKDQNVQIQDTSFEGDFTNVFIGADVITGADVTKEMALGPWEYVVLAK